MLPSWSLTERSPVEFDGSNLCGIAPGRRPFAADSPWAPGLLPLELAEDALDWPNPISETFSIGPGADDIVTMAPPGTPYPAAFDPLPDFMQVSIEWGDISAFYYDFQEDLPGGGHTCHARVYQDFDVQVTGGSYATDVTSPFSGDIVQWDSGAGVPSAVAWDPGSGEHRLSQGRVRLSIDEDLDREAAGGYVGDLANTASRTLLPFGSVPVAVKILQDNLEPDTHGYCVMNSGFWFNVSLAFYWRRRTAEPPIPGNIVAGPMRRKTYRPQPPRLGRRVTP